MTGRLEKYNRKRNFERTGEPEGKLKGEPEGEPKGEPKSEPECEPEIKPEKHEGRLRFAVQHHLARRDHFDLRLEWGGVLLSWAVPKGPSYNTRDRRLAVQVEDHPVGYRNFEGTIPRGEYGGGTVMIWDEGFWEPQTDVDKGLDTGSLKFVLRGIRLKGKWALIRLKAKKGGDENNWLLLKEKDEYSGNDDGISGFATSVRTGRTMKEIEEGAPEKLAKNPFGKTNVQLARLAENVPKGEDWLYELKYDGYRIVAYLENNSARLVTRNGHDHTGKFRDIAYSLTEWAAGRAMVLDGEMVVADTDGRTDFQALQSYMRNPGSKKLTYIIFDLLALDGKDLRGRSLVERKKMLEALMKDSPGNLFYSRHVRGNGEACFLAACKSGMEGVVGKKAGSVYSGTRNGDWIKLKCDKRQEFVIGGYTLSDKKTSGVSSLLLGVYEGEELVYTGRAGTGFTERGMKELEEKFGAIKRKTSPFKQAPETKKSEKITWLEPVLVAEVRFSQWTDDNLLRQASFKGLRTDRDPADVRRESTGKEISVDDMEQEDIKLAGREQENGKPADESSMSHKSTGVKSKNKQTPETSPEKPGKGGGGSIIIGGIKITSPDKVIFTDPEIRKLDVVRYYEKVSEHMMPYVGSRILSIVRCPRGISEPCFFKKHPGPDSKGIVTIPVLSGSGENKEYFYIGDVSGIISEAQMGTLEFHTWGSRADNLEKPDIMVFDLDPDEGMDLERVRRGVKDIKSLLDGLSLVSFLKTSGGKGYHVVIPFKPSAGWEAFYDFAAKIAEIMEQKWPDRYTSNVRKDRRKNRIFIDWIRNGRGATSIAPYSIRARKGAPVSMPITWEELDTVPPDGVDMAGALARIGGDDPWKDFFHVGQRLK
jgi:bifunctional non-homologous end joining protein LigD